MESDPFDVAIKLIGTGLIVGGEILCFKRVDARVAYNG